MSEHQNTQPENPDGSQEPHVGKREFLGKLGRWSGASIAAVIGGVAWLSSSGTSTAASWINRGGWVNRGGSWINGGGSWVNRSGGGGGWVNRGGGGGWVNRRGGGGWINRR